MFVRHMFRKVKHIIPEKLSSTTASVASNISSTDYGANFDITIVATTHDTWVNPIGTATTNSFLLAEADAISMTVENTLSIISDSTLAKIQAIIWG